MTTLKEFLTESNHIEGIYSEPTENQIERIKDFLELKEIKVEDVCNLVNTLQKGEMIRAAHGLDVYVGNHRPPPGCPNMPKFLQEILDKYKDNFGEKAAYFQHIEYETLHPFTDGNGRSGRILWLYKMGRLRYLRKDSIGFLHRWYYQSLQFSHERIQSKIQPGN